MNATNVELPEVWRELAEKNMRDEAAMKTRRIGSTDIACIAAFYSPALAADLPKNKTAGDVFARLAWGLEARSNSRMQRGLRLEPFGLDYYEEHVGPWWRALPLGEWWVVADPLSPDFTASPDAFDSPSRRIIIELKTQSEWARPQWGMPGTDQMATRYLYQAQWLLARCGAEQAHVLCLFGNDFKDEHGRDDFAITEPAIYVVHRDNDLLAQLDAYAERFLSEFVRTGIPPPVKPALNRTEAKRHVNATGRESANEWYERCDARAAALGLDEWGRPARSKAEKSGNEAGGGDGLG